MLSGCIMGDVGSSVLKTKREDISLSLFFKLSQMYGSAILCYVICFVFCHFRAFYNYTHNKFLLLSKSRILVLKWLQNRNLRHFFFCCKFVNCVPTKQNHLKHFFLFFKAVLKQLQNKKVQADNWIPSLNCTVFWYLPLKHKHLWRNQFSILIVFNE